MMNIFYVYAYSSEYMPTLAHDDESLSYEENDDMKASLANIMAGRVINVMAGLPSLSQVPKIPSILYG